MSFTSVFLPRVLVAWKRRELKETVNLDKLQAKWITMVVELYI